MSNTEQDTLRSMLAMAKSDQEAHKARLEEYQQDHISHSYAEDTVAQIKRTEQKIANGELRIKALEYAVSLFPEDTTTHLLTAADFVQAGDNLIYVGPFEPAVQFIRNNCEVSGPNLNPNGLWTVELDGGNVWGTADTQEMAWRYAMGAEFGPIDDEFVPFRFE